MTVVDGVVDRYPPTVMIVGYGSGVVHQSGYDYASSLPLVDTIFIVDDIRSWHAANYAMNRHHYRGLSSILGPSFVSWMAVNYFPMTFIPHVDIVDGVEGKYAVIDRRLIIDDLMTWSINTAAVRLQKPVKIVEIDASKSIGVRHAMNANIEQVFSVARLMESKNGKIDGSELENLDKLIERIVGLSYIGDLRTKVGAEAADKPKKILEGNKEKLDQLYRPLYLRAKQDPSWLRLPSMISETDSKEAIINKLSAINARSSFRMAVSQFILDSPTRNLKYVWAKLRKGIFK